MKQKLSFIMKNRIVQILLLAVLISTPVTIWATDCSVPNYYCPPATTTPPVASTTPPVASTTPPTATSTTPTPGTSPATSTSGASQTSGGGGCAYGFNFQTQACNLSPVTPAQTIPQVQIIVPVGCITTPYDSCKG